MSDIGTLSGLVNLETLNFSGTKIKDISPLKNLTKLKKLTIINNSDITNEQIEELQKAMPNLKIEK